VGAKEFFSRVLDVQVTDVERKESDVFLNSKSLQTGILPAEGSTLRLPLLLMHHASGVLGNGDFIGCFLGVYVGS